MPGRENSVRGPRRACGPPGEARRIASPRCRPHGRSTAGRWRATPPRDGKFRPARNAQRRVPAPSPVRHPPGVGDGTGRQGALLRPEVRDPLHGLGAALLQRGEVPGGAEARRVPLRRFGDRRVAAHRIERSSDTTSSSGCSGAAGCASTDAPVLPAIEACLRRGSSVKPSCPSPDHGRDHPAGGDHATVAARVVNMRNVEPGDTAWIDSRAAACAARYGW